MQSWISVYLSQCLYQLMSKGLCGGTRILRKAGIQRPPHCAHIWEQAICHDPQSSSPACLLQRWGVAQFFHAFLPFDWAVAMQDMGAISPCQACHFL